MKQLAFLVDANGLITRNWKASREAATRVLVGRVVDIIKTYHPKSLVMCYDWPGDTFRHELYPEYKSNRPEKDPSLVRDIERSQLLMLHAGITVASAPKLEADDVIACYIKKHWGKYDGFCILSNDKDMRQLLVPGKVTIGRKAQPHGIGDMRRLDVDWFNSEMLDMEWGITPSQCVDFQVLCGDQADNVPGVKGVGPVTAGKMLRKFGSVDGIYQRIDELGESARESMQEFHQFEPVSRRLVQLVSDEPIEVSSEPRDESKFLEVGKGIEWRHDYWKLLFSGDCDEDF